MRNVPFIPVRNRWYALALICRRVRSCTCEKNVASFSRPGVLIIKLSEAVCLPLACIHVPVFHVDRPVYFCKQPRALFTFRTLACLAVFGCSTCVFKPVIRWFCLITSPSMPVVTLMSVAPFWYQSHLVSSSRRLVPPAREREAQCGVLYTIRYQLGVLA